MNFFWLPDPSAAQPWADRRRMLVRLGIALGIFVFAFGTAALRSRQAPDIFTDEIVYTRAAIRVAAEGALVWDSGVPFLVHPPLYFLLAGLYTGLTGASQVALYSPGDIFESVYLTRLLNAIFAGLTALAVYAFSRRLAVFEDSPENKRRLLWLGLSAAVLFALDPFGVRTNRRAKLETLAALLTLQGMLLYWSSIRRKTDASPAGPLPLSPRALWAGLVLGASMLAKELAFIHLFALLLFAVWEFILALPGLLPHTRGLRRLLLPLRVPAMINALAAVLLAASTYLIYPLWAFSTGRWDLYSHEKLLGLQRLLGLVQLTGWNREGISFFSLFLQRLQDYGTTYLLLALGGAAAVWLALMGLRRVESPVAGSARSSSAFPDNTLAASARSSRLLASWGLVIYPFLAFLMLFGSGNDQFFYYLLAPAVLLVVAAAFSAARLAERALPKTEAIDEAQALAVLAEGRRKLKKSRAVQPTPPAQIPAWREVLHHLERFILRAARFTPLALLALMLPFNTYKWVDKYLVSQDNGYAQLAEFVSQNLPPTAAINATGDPIKFAYFFPERPVYALAQPAQAQAAGIEYFALAPKDVALRYGRITPELATWIIANGEPLFAFDGDSYGEIILFRVASQTASAADANPPQPVERRFQIAQSGFVDSLVAMLILWVSAWGLMSIFLRRILKSEDDAEASLPLSAAE